MSTWKRFRPLLVLTAGICMGGCTSPGISFVSSRCEDARDGRRLKSLAVVSTITANNLEGEQLVYQVRLFDRERRPLRSQDGRYQTADGSVAATTTLMVLTSPQTFTNVRVSIPAAELGVPPNHVPVLAEITVCKAGGERVARAWRSLPALKIAEIMPPLSTSPAPIPYWFVKVSAQDRLPLLLGPFASLQEAEAAVTGQTEAPRQINSDQHLWFVPFYSANAEQKALLVGPCLSEEDAKQIPGLSEGMSDSATRGLAAGAPVQVQIRQWLKEREVSQALSARPAESTEGATAGQSQTKE